MTVFRDGIFRNDGADTRAKKVSGLGRWYKEKLRRARELVDKGLTVREAAMRLKVGKTALYEALRHA